LWQKTDIFRFPFPPFTISGESGERGEEKRERGVEESVGEGERVEGRRVKRVEEDGSGK
jgi:hypothetical protein